MCGFIALLGNYSSDVASETLGPALQQMRARGPDSEGLWQDTGVMLGHRRLAILDLDPRSHQPMLSACGRYAIAFNGEIYNFRDLRSQLERKGVVFCTTSDTEVLLALFALDGAAMLPRLRGMFAFVIWDRLAKRGFAARDPYGIKPLYYAQTPDGVFMASQVKALLATGKVSHAPDARGQAVVERGDAARAATEHDAVGIDDVDDHCETARQSLDIIVEYCACARIARRRCIGDRRRE